MIITLHFVNTDKVHQPAFPQIVGGISAVFTDEMFDY